MSKPYCTICGHDEGDHKLPSFDPKRGCTIQLCTCTSYVAPPERPSYRTRGDTTACDLCGGSGELPDGGTFLRETPPEVPQLIPKYKRIQCFWCGWCTEPRTETNDRCEDMQEHLTGCTKRLSEHGKTVYRAWKKMLDDERADHAKTKARLDRYTSPCGKEGHVRSRGGTTFFCQTCYYEDRIAELTAKVLDLEAR